MKRKVLNPPKKVKAAKKKATKKPTKKRKKKLKRPYVNGPAVRFRDINIFIILVDGPMPIQKIRDLLAQFKGKSPIKETHSSNHDMTIDVLSTRLRKLMKGDYLQSRRYQARNEEKNLVDVFSLYALTPKAAPFLNYKGYTISQMRMELPSPDHVTHEMLVVDTLSFARRNLDQLGMDYKVEDENALMAKADKTMTDMAFPDLYFVLTFPVDGVLMQAKVSMEVDNGTMTAERVFNKTKLGYKQRGGIPVILVKSVQRKDELQLEFVEQTNNLILNRPDAEVGITKMRKQILFATFFEFYSKGFFETVWKDMDDYSRRILPADYTGKPKKE